MSWLLGIGLVIQLAGCSEPGATSPEVERTDLRVVYGWSTDYGEGGYRAVTLSADGRVSTLRISDEEPKWIESAISPATRSELQVRIEKEIAKAEGVVTAGERYADYSEAELMELPREEIERIVRPEVTMVFAIGRRVAASGEWLWTSDAYPPSPEFENYLDSLGAKPVSGAWDDIRKIIGMHVPAETPY